MAPWIGTAVTAGLLALAVLFYRLRVRSLEAQLASAADAARGSEERARQLEGALLGLKGHLEKEAADDLEAAGLAVKDPATAGAFLRDSVARDDGVRPPGVTPPAEGRLPATHLAHRARFVPGFGRGR